MGYLEFKRESSKVLLPFEVDNMLGLASDSDIRGSERSSFAFDSHGKNLA